MALPDQFQKNIDMTLIAIVSVFLFTWGLNGQEIIGFDSRFYLFALEMWQNGLSWFPTTYHHPYPDYLATSTIFIYLISTLFGGVTKLTAILPTAIAAMITLIFVYLIGALRDRKLGLAAVFFMLTTLTFLQSARSISLDMFISMVTSISFYLVYSADIKRTRQPTLSLYLLFLFGFIVRGPIGFIIPTGVICSYYLMDKQFKRSLFIGCIAALVLIIAMVSLSILAYDSGNLSFFQKVLRMQFLGRMAHSFLPYHFYFSNSLKNYAFSFPLACLTIVGFIYYQLFSNEKILEADLFFKLCVWTAVIMIGMSIPGEKKTRYILSIAPAVSLLAAYLVILPEKQTYFFYLRSIITKIFLMLPVVLFVILWMTYHYAQQHHWQLNIPYFYLSIFFIFVQLAALYVYFRNDQDILRLFNMLPFVTIIFVMTYIRMVEPIELYLDRSQTFVLELEKKRLKAGALLIFYKEKPDNLPIKYLIYKRDQHVPPLFINQAQDIKKVVSPAYFITSQEYYSDLTPAMKQNLKVIATNKLGHVPVVVFINNRLAENK